MKYIITFAAIIFLCQCKKNPEEPYPNENVVMDNAQAALYFHTIFREVENAWAFVDSMDYRDGPYPDEASKSTFYKKLTYDGNAEIVTIEYNAWETNHLFLWGTITVSFNVDSYRREGKIAHVLLTDFAINQQYVEGQVSIKFNKRTGDNDNYTFTLLEGAAIHEYGHAMPVLISCTISNGQYERTEGNKTLIQDDDVWVYTGVMTGMLHNDPNLKYTNTVNTTSPYEENGVRKDGKIYYSMNCMFAEQGLSQITIPKRPTIVYLYGCSGYFFESVTHID